MTLLQRLALLAVLGVVLAAATHYLTRSPAGSDAPQASQAQ